LNLDVLFRDLNHGIVDVVVYNVDEKVAKKTKAPSKPEKLEAWKRRRCKSIFRPCATRTDRAIAL
jgi:hypothetical protein